MPANLTPEYRKAEEAFREAKTRDEKIAAIEHMMAVIPKHKGTDHLQGDLKRRLSKLREMDDKVGGKRGDPFRIEREGAGQAVLLGPPNCGKSSILAALTNARPDVAPYPFTTSRPLPGMMDYEDIQIQLIDTSPVTSDHFEQFHSNLARNGDLSLCVVDLTDSDPVAQFNEIISIFASRKIKFAPERTDEIIEYGVAYKKALVLANKYDLDEDDILLNAFREAAKTDLPVIPISATAGDGLEEMRRLVFASLNILRVYSKIPGRQPDMDSPFVLPEGSSVMDVARTVHNDFAASLKYARIWGSEKFDGQKVQRDYIVHDKDIIELHI
ncbi:MAG: GTPase [bacterium]